MKQLYAIDKKGEVKHWTIEVLGDTIVVRHGKLGGKMQAKETTVKGKNIGKANETSPAEQASREAEAKYTKQLDKCYRPTIEEAKNVGEALPMLAHNYLQQSHRIVFPCDVSPKLDGVRCIASITGDEVTLHSRGGKTYDCPEHIRRELILVAKKAHIEKLDGELYIHGLPLQDIVSAVKKPNMNTHRLEFHVFDIPVQRVPWLERKNTLEAVEQAARLPIKVVKNVTVNNEAAARIFLNKYMNEGYEGLMLRNHRGAYEFNHRSHNLQKWKLMNDAEALVLDVEKDLNDEGVLICRMAGTERVFRCKMKGDHEFRSYGNQKGLVGKWITYKYQALTNDGLPQFPVGLYIRECDEEGNPIE
ncbi:putative DNA ligase [Salmonella phage pSal-SNUABM-01]|nr:putative DNA ligase [Salmonella phage pSal-SNUABM-01]